MRKLILAFVVHVAVTAGMAQEWLIRVRNPAPFERGHETIEVSTSALLGDRGYAVAEDGKPILSQVIEGDSMVARPSLLIFQSGFRPGEEKPFSVKILRTGGEADGITDAKFILPRRDVAWENDRIAFRIYGGPLAGDVRDGIDVWVKRVRYHIIDTWYDGDSLRGTRRISYHVDHGEGADFFNVGRSLGAGGAALWKDGALCQAGLFTSYRIIARGPIRASFRVSYEAEPLRGLSAPQERTYSLDAGENLNRIDISYGLKGEEGETRFAAGLVKRSNTVRSGDEQLGWMSLWGRTNDDSTTGELGTGVVVPRAFSLGPLEEADHHLLLMKAAPGGKLTYYAGAGWTRSGDFNTREEWESYLSEFARGLDDPLEIKVERVK